MLLTTIQVGPYTYRQKWLKQNVTWNNNGTISYKTRKVFTFTPSESCPGCSEKDNITTLNVPAITAYLKVQLRIAKTKIIMILILFRTVILSFPMHWRLSYTTHLNIELGWREMWLIFSGGMTRNCLRLPLISRTHLRLKSKKVNYDRKLKDIPF